jgi:hypothetical protein
MLGGGSMDKDELLLWAMVVMAIFLAYLVAFEGV